MLIDKIDMDFGIGLCVLTGETGAGKSMILESLELLSGRRVKGNIRSDNGKKTVITALVEISNYSLIKNQLDELDIKFEEEIIIKRIIDCDGKSKALINDSLVGLTTLKAITSKLFEIHSQFSEQGLLDNSTHITTLDDFGCYQSELKKLSEKWFELRTAEKNYCEERSRFEEIKNKRDEFEIYYKELRNFEPKKGEYQKLQEKKKLLQNSRKINENLNQIINNFIREDPPGIEKLFSKNLLMLNQIRDLLDQTTLNEIDKLDSISFEASEICKTFENFLNQELDHSSLEKVDDRVSNYRKLSEKHLTEPDLLESKLIEIKNNLELTEESSLNIEKLAQNFKSIQKEYLDQSEIISNLRKENAEILDNKINSEFPDLKLENACFKTIVSDCENSELGKDKVVFNIRTNPKSKMGEIKSISSGGELCRIALAIKVTAEKENSSTMVFDEVDSGIGGAVSTAVGERLKKLGQNRQVLVVTHSPQVASLGVHHFLVKKKLQNDSTSIDVIKIDGHHKTNEIARMLSGKQITNEAVEAARKLIES
tara:strand:- start:1428 stop:3050 length:1623 start_codon:yes stop_codon:yes gene_type:complete